MFLTREEYAGGYLDGDADIPPGGSVTVEVQSWAGPGLPPTVQGPYGVEGSVLDEPIGDSISYRIGMTRGLDPTQTPVLRRIRLERDGRTLIFTPPTWGHPVMSLGRDFGTSCRLIIKPNQASWDQSVVLLLEDIRIRFWLEPLRLSQMSKATPTEVDGDGQLIVQTKLDDTYSEGSVIEILVTQIDEYGDRPASRQESAPRGSWRC